MIKKRIVFGLFLLSMLIISQFSLIIVQIPMANLVANFPVTQYIMKHEVKRGLIL